MELDLYHLIYTSIIDADVNPSCVGDIIRTSRVKNRLDEITGLLVFDGWRFCQYIEGEREAVRSLAQIICEDVRHTQFTVLHEGPLDSGRMFADWSMAYALSQDDELLPGLSSLRGLAAVHRLHGLLPSLDMEP